ncbi:prostaglandin F2 receptor negative regulator [Kryptolebias marmoratus]|uniref:Prostaglandin F2 receptor inhibitor b n=1 Tax=Kryptolebias marmoratus TaxID=37003 RepID=A0A3Q3FXR3_KRYMA|nr:prostaglandin F2 receptor negative regulator [Kryptolebias marmoratus]
MFTRLLTLAFGLFLVGGCSARVVTVPPGPLIRVEGQPVSIRCNVTDYGGPREQEFEWKMSRDGKSKINIISTFDLSFSDPSLSNRIASGDISVVRLQDNEVELKVAEAKLQDAGSYICETPSTDTTASGNYEAQVQLTVIPKTLKVSPETPPQVVPEGRDLTLTCNVTRELTYPTYLSVTWSIKKGATSEDILTFGPQGEVTTGSKFTHRYSDGGIRLAPGRNGVFELVISRVMTSDQGTYECNGTEWTYDRGGRWTRIVESKKEMGTVSVTPAGHSLNVKASFYSSPSSTSLLLSPGDSLTLLCSVLEKPDTLTLEVTWLANGREILTMDRSGVVLSNASSSGAPGKQGDATLERTGVGEYRLGVRGVSGEDGGLYACRIRAFVEKGGHSAGGGRWYMVAEKTSTPVTVKVSETKPNFTLSLSVTQKPSRMFEPMELSCSVTDISSLPQEGRLAVSWEHTSLPGKGNANAQHVGSLDGNGNLVSGKPYADKLKSGVLSLSRIQPNTFKLQFLRTQDSDMGQFACTVSSWSVSSQGDLVKTSEYKSSPLTVRWDDKRPALNVVAKTIRGASRGGDTFEMSCAVTPANLGGWLGYRVDVNSQDSENSNTRTVLSLSSDNVVQHTDPDRRDSVGLTKTGPAEFRFRLAGVQLSDRGFYWCNITAVTKLQPEDEWTNVASSESNKIRINFQENGPSFSVDINSDASSVYPWETAKIECSLSVSGSSPKADDLSYEVTWFFTRLRGGEKKTELASIDRFGVIAKIHRNSSSDVSIERRDTHTYLLNLYGTQDSDSGEYHCIATPWYLSTSTGAWTEAKQLTSKRIFLSVKFAVWDSLKLPLLYGAAASLGVGLFSLLLGLVCAHCCCRNTTHTPRSHNKLLNFEMD